MQNIPRKKYPFWSKKGKPSSTQSEVLKKIKDIAKQHNISEDAIVQKYGLANDINSLEQMYAFIQKDINQDAEQVKKQSEHQQPETQQPNTMQNQSDLETHEEKNNNNQIPPEPDHYGASTRERSYAGGTGAAESTLGTASETNDTGKAGSNSSEPTSDIPETGTQNIGSKEINEGRVKFGAESYVQGYNEIVLGFGKMISQFSVRKLKKLHRNKQIDLKTPLEFEDGTKQSIEDYCDEFNQDVEEKLVPDPDKDARITSALVEVMKKHGHEPSPEQVLVQEVLYDLKEKVKAIVELAATKSDTLDFFIESHAEKMEALKNSNNNDNNSGNNGNNSNNNGKNEEGLTPTEVVI